MSHFLIIIEPGEIEIEHPADCPTIEIYDGVHDEDCGIGQVIRYEGFEALGPMLGDAWQDIAPGRYEIEYWHETHRNRFGQDEFECGIRYVEEAP